MHRLQMQQVIGLLLMPWLLAGCGASGAEATAAPPTLTPPPPTEAPLESSGINFTGRLLAATDEGVYEFAWSPSTRTVQQTLIAADAKFAALSPDKAYLAYYSAADSAVRWRHLASGELRTLSTAAESVACLSWSPTSDRFSAVIGDQLKVYNLSGDLIQVLYQPPSARYSLDGKGVPLTINGRVDCGVWISPDSLIFQRTRIMPDVLEDAMPLDTTALAVLGATPAFTDSLERWYVPDVCPDKNLVLLANEAGQVFLAEAFQDFNDMQRRALDVQFPANSADRLRGRIGFLPGADCWLYYELPAIGYDGAPGEIHIVDPGSLEERPGYTIAAGRITTWWDGVWVGAPQDGLAVVGEAELYAPDGVYVVIVDLKTGARGRLATITGSNDLRLLGWLP